MSGKLILYAGALFLMLGVSCNQSPATIPATSPTPPPASKTPMTAPTATHTLTPLSTFTSTSAPTFTVTPTPIVPAVSNVDKLDLRYGPGLEYPIMIQYFGAQGIEFPVVGQSEDGEWLVVDLGFDQLGWVEASAVDYRGDTALLMLVDAPPSPTPQPISTAPRIYLHHVTRFQPSLSKPIGYSVYFIALEGFQPGEEVTITGIETATGRQVTQFTRTMDGAGSGSFYWAHKNNSPAITIVFTARGDLGSYASFSQSFW